MNFGSIVALFKGVTQTHGFLSLNYSYRMNEEHFQITPLVLPFLQSFKDFLMDCRQFHA